jgi:hypothetical protein
MDFLPNSLAKAHLTVVRQFHQNSRIRNLDSTAVVVGAAEQHSTGHEALARAAALRVAPPPCAERQVSFLGDARSFLGDAKSSLGDTKSSLGDAKISLGDAKISLGDAESSLGDAESSLGDAESSLGDAKSSLGDAESSLGDAAVTTT